MKKVITILIISLLFILTPTVIKTVSAQPPPPPPKQIPIDGGLGALLVAGMIYGAKKIYENREQESFPE